MHHRIQRIARWLLAALLLALGQQALALSAGCQAINATFGTLQTFGPPDAYGEFVTDTLEAGERVMYRVTTSNSKAPPGSGSGFYIVNSDAPELTAESVAGDELDLDGTFVIPRTGEYGFGVWRESQSSEQIGTITRQLRCEEPAPPEPPAITAQPPSPLTLAVGGSGTISVTASNATAYQWEVDTGSGYTPIADGAPYTGTDTATLQITGATLGMNGYLYRVRVSGAVAPPALSDAAALAVTRAASTVTLGATPLSPVYGATVTFTATVAGGASPTGTVEFWEGATQLGSSTLASGTATFQTAALAAGNHTVTAAYTGDDNNAPASSSAQSVTVAQATQTVAFTSAAPVGAVVGGSYTPAASATSGLAAVISVDTASSGVCAMASGVVSFTAPGTCTLNADQPGDANHTAAPQVQQAVAVTAAPSVPGAPTGVTATPGDAAVRVGWTAPPSPPDITGYTVTTRTLPGLAFAGSCTAAADSANCVIDGLDNGTAHAFTVHAANAQGDGPESDAVHATPSKLLPTGTTVPGTSGGLAAVVIGGGQPGCALSGAPQFSDTGIPGGAPANASFPVGAFHFDAAGCKSDTLTVSITYPQPLPDNVQLMKYGPKTALATTSEWFPAPSASLSLDRKTVTYTVRDNGPGDSNPAEGVITDPFAPMLLPPPATHAVTATASPSAGGTVQCTPNPVTEGDTATCTASANTGYTFAAWTGACAGQGATCSLPNVTAPQASVA